ncbi:hypothetical protein VTJ83DRAFT_3108 [Remersonia thermophila]|uniref:Carboxylic ester hydrolase n=1 Tax=Remersonia thermophila TaxID=72144 RepID=A0ABR4DFA2_9PEZI
MLFSPSAFAAAAAMFFAFSSDAFAVRFPSFHRDRHVSSQLSPPPPPPPPPGVAPLAPTPHLPCEPSTFFAALDSPEHAITIENATVVPAGGEAGEVEGANPAYKTNPTDLPALCAVTVKVASSTGGGGRSSYRFGVFLPEAWDRRLLVVGNGGWAGGVNWLDMAVGVRSGMAALSTDTGHNSTSTNSTWARGNPEAKADWGWRAMHGSTVLGKRLVAAYYAPAGQTLARTYYSGCSTGGRQGLKELQLFPGSFDGALIGAPAWWVTHLNPYIAQVGVYNHLPEDGPQKLTPHNLTVLAEEVVRQCDAADGVADGIVGSPEACAPDLRRLLCPEEGGEDAPTDGCLNAAQLETVRKIYSDWYLPGHDGHGGHDGNRTLLHPGLTVSSEKQWTYLVNGTEPSPYGVGYARDFLFDDPDWDWRTFDADVVRTAEARNPGDATADDHAALARVRDRGGKIILYHGMADGLVPTKGTELFYARTAAALAGAAAAAAAGAGDDGAGGIDDFLRLFLVPGLQHCWNTAVDAPWNFGAAFQAGFMGSGVAPVPGFDDARHNALKALIEWVERGAAVDSIVATAWNELKDPASGVKRQRPVCAWPRRAVWDGEGDVNAAESWSCVAVR